MSVTKEISMHASPYWQMQPAEFKEKYERLLLKKGANVVLYCQPNSDMKTPAGALAYYLPQILDTLLEDGKRTFIFVESSYKGKRDFFEQIISHLLSRKEQYPIKTIGSSRREFFSLYPCDDCLEMALLLPPDYHEFSRYATLRCAFNDCPHRQVCRFQRSKVYQYIFPI